MIWWDWRGNGKLKNKSHYTSDKVQETDLPSKPSTNYLCLLFQPQLVSLMCLILDVHVQKKRTCPKLNDLPPIFTLLSAHVVIHHLFALAHAISQERIDSTLQVLSQNLGMIFSHFILYFLDLIQILI